MNIKRAILRMLAGEDILAPRRKATIGGTDPSGERLAHELNVARLVCYGCAHSIGCAPYPGAPSGERPCMFCIRNPNQADDLDAVQRHSPSFVSPRYDNGPVATIPSDQYIATDRLIRDLPQGAHIIT